MKVGDIVKFKEDHYLAEVIPGLLIVDKVKKFQFRTNKQNRYHIITLNKDSDGSRRMTWVDEPEVISISEIRNYKLKSLGI
jgi:hypothetical protein